MWQQTTDRNAARKALFVSVPWRLNLKNRVDGSPDECSSESTEMIGREELTVMRVTVCQLSDERDGFASDWEGLVAHVKSESSDLVLLPEMPFSRWFALGRDFDPGVWQAAVAAHDAWLARLHPLAPAVVLGSRPVNAGSYRRNEGFIWDQELGYRAVHSKYYLPNEEGYWEASWYGRGEGDFTPVQSGVARIGFAICTELWFLERARAYGQQGVQIIVTPRATGSVTVDKWLVGGRACAVVSGAFSLSSNRVSAAGQATDFGGQGWVVDPDGAVLGLTSREQPFVTVEIDLHTAELARQTYPRYVRD